MNAPVILECEQAASQASLTCW